MRFVAFLRAINVGGRVVKMERLRSIFEGMGFKEVETFIASGNVIFTSHSANAKTLEQKIERALKRSLGYDAIPFVRSCAELAQVAKHEPFGAAEIHPVYIAFAREPVSPAAAKKLRELENEIDLFRVKGREVYWLCRKSFSESTFSGAQLEKILGTPVTIRNTTTVRKLAAKYPAL